MLNISPHSYPSSYSHNILQLYVRLQKAFQNILCEIVSVFLVQKSYLGLIKYDVIRRSP